MTIHQALLTAAREPLLTICFLLLTLQAFLIIAVWRDTKNRRIVCMYAAHFLISFAFLYLSIWDVIFQIYENGTAGIPSVLAVYGSMPVQIMIIYEMITAVTGGIAVTDISRYRKEHLTSESIKETMDLLPVGIAFAGEDGTVVFSNLAMNGILHRLTEQGQAELNGFGEVPESGKEIETQIRFPDGSSWQITGETIKNEGESFTQFTAADITEQAKITRELEDKNKKLRELHMRLDIYNRQADRIIIAQELLNARMIVHNEVGSVLLESRRYLNDPSSFDEKLLLEALKNTNTYLLREYEQDDTERDPLAEALETADAIGVDISITGFLPSEDPQRMILAAAITECASNTVKHAGGDSLEAVIRKTDEGIIYTFTNSGDQPEGPVHESGGLLALRTLVEQENGTMETSYENGFRLTVRLPYTVWAGHR
ncbi:MAG: hypothetical protein K6G61_12435 [Solobacterium sp.]|nr:hypothetical protein [Solobacterium sp.]